MAGRVEWTDSVGRCGSGACLAHCLVTPLLAGAAGVGRLVGTVELWFHPAAAVVLVPLTLLAMQGGEARTRSLLGSGALLLVLAVGAQVLDLELGATFLTVAGSVLLLLGHRRRSRTTGRERRCGAA